jgi:hypothetical protein
MSLNRAAPTCSSSKINPLKLYFEGELGYVKDNIISCPQ